MMLSHTLTVDQATCRCSHSHADHLNRGRCQRPGCGCLWFVAKGGAA